MKTALLWRMASELVMLTIAWLSLLIIWFIGHLEVLENCQPNATSEKTEKLT